MAIPGARMEDVPPTLPPPRYMHDLDEGVDLAWRYQNEDILDGRSTLAPIKPGSTLLGRTQLSRDEDEDIEMEMDDDSGVRADRPSTTATGTPIPSLIRRPPSSSGINQKLHGENPLAQQNHNQSTHAYDKHLLLKIGKGHSPPSRSRHTSISGPKLSINTRGTNLLARPESTTSLEPVTRWLTSPTSAISPTTRHWRDFSMDPKSPSSESITEHDPFARPPPRSRMGSAHEDSRTRSERGSYDSSVFTDPDSIDERPRLPLHHGTKRRALSSPHEQEQPRLQVRTDRQAPPSQPYKAPSLSSTASSTNYSSYTSSTLPSAASSMTTASFLETPRSSSRYLTSPSTIAPAAIQPLRKPLEPTSNSLQSTTSEARSPPSKIGNHYICGCCPKKPKKFETEELLRAHENEKQYACAYCNNRFKNKNEAERHQNSLHLRKQSWSCATMSTYQAAFHPSAFSNPRNLTTDTCGFCGEEFSNHPQNWEDRIQHLTDVHKFGECNSKKKFFRADHFRQHLKHSHAGKSGKWTNILENSCQREEAMSEHASLSPTASEHSQSGRHGNPIDASMGGVESIDEQEE